ncbi:MAG: sigma-54 dependent transcriptional regulator [Spirochaetaceae bacterium]
MNKRILIVDDEEQLCISLSKLLKAKGYDPVYTVNPEHALHMLRENPCDLLITDLKMPELSGIDLILQIRKVYSKLPILMVSGYASVENVVQAMRYGAINFFEKPVRFANLLKEIEPLLSDDESNSDIYSPESNATKCMISANPIMRKKIKMISKVAPTDVPVLITGESGTGKELAASAIHSYSSREGKPFLKLNCAAIPEALLESELFGYEKGAFTDASESRPGKFEVAEGGTIFLDEIGEMSTKTQAKLLRVIQEKEYERLGSHKTRKMDVRIVAATNRDLKERITGGTFREDLYYRLSVIQIELPSLKQRLEDILSLSRAFVKEFSIKYGKNIDGFTSEVDLLFLQHDWPGNIRELRNTVERMVIFCDEDTLGMDVIPEQYKIYSPKEKVLPLRNVSDNITREIILDTLDKTNNSRGKTADFLGITRRTLYNKMKKLGIEV